MVSDIKTTFDKKAYKKIGDVFDKKHTKAKTWEDLYALLPEHKIIDNNKVIKDYLKEHFNATFKLSKKGKRSSHKMQTGFLTEALLIADLANAYGMKLSQEISEKGQEYSARAEYTDGQGNYIFQLGQPDQTDALLIKNNQLTWLEIKEPNAKFGETDLAQNEQGKLSIRAKDYDKWAFYQPIIDKFNENHNAWDTNELKLKEMGITDDQKIGILGKYFQGKHIDKIMTWDLSTENIAFYTLDEIRGKLADKSIEITGEIRIGKSRIGWKQNTAPKKAVELVKKQGTVNDNIATLDFNEDQIDKRSKNKYKISKIFFVYTKPSEKRPKSYVIAKIENGKIIFPIESIVQIPDLISFRLQFVK